MSLWKRFWRKGKSQAEPLLTQRDIPEGAMSSVQTLTCDPKATDAERRFAVGKWSLRVAPDEDSQRLARGVLKRSAGKSLRLDPHAVAGHRGVISSVSKDAQGAGYSWIYVDVDLRAGTITFRQGGSADLPTPQV